MKKKNNKLITYILVAAIILFASFFQSSSINKNKENVIEKNSVVDEEKNNSKENTTDEKAESTEDESVYKVKVHYIDVGQADSILVQVDDKNLLIDAGNNDDYNTIDNYLKKQNVAKLDYVVATHAHEDHIGSMDDVIKNYNVDKVYMAKHTTTTKTFKNFVTAVSEKGLKLTVPKPGEEFYMDDVKFKVLGPISEKYDNINEYSIVLKMTYKDESFLFTGDMEAINEDETIENFSEDIKDIDVLKVAHHGGKYSSQVKFLNMVKPQYAIISVGKGNDYGHPTTQTLNRLSNVNAEVYRTDLNGTIVISTNGEKLKIQKEK